MFELIEVVRMAAADAERAERLYGERSFREELREGTDVLRRFRVTTLGAGRGTGREMPASWKLRLDPARARPVL